MKRRKMVIGIVITLTIIFLLFLLSILLNNNTNSKKGSQKQEKLETMNYTYESRVDKLNDFDAGTVQKMGWLQVQGTTIDVPIISSLLDEKIDYNYGWLVGASFGYDTRLILAGHNILNVSAKPMVNDSNLTNFEDLMAFVYYDFAKDNMYLVYTKNGVDKLYVIYAVGFYDYNYKYDANGLDKNEIEEYVKFVKKNSIYDYGIEVNENDDIITIKTCTRMFGLNEKQQFQIDAKLVNENEKLLKYNVKKTKLYEEYNLKDKYEESFS